MNFNYFIIRILALKNYKLPIMHYYTKQKNTLNSPALGWILIGWQCFYCSSAGIFFFYIVSYSVLLHLFTLIDIILGFIVHT